MYTLFQQVLFIDLFISLHDDMLTKTMLHLSCYSIALFALLSLVVDTRYSSPFDVHIDHYKVDTTRDLVVNKPRPRFSWKIPVSNDSSQRNIQQTAYQIQLQSIEITKRDHPFEWDSGRVWITNCEDSTE